ncbi:MAG: dockerin type I repeat-containing protein [Muribaculaceae bacterium]|nr:dockerin type I repeat-containing protein [Muribaculaceae bacterium]
MKRSALLLLFLVSIMASVAAQELLTFDRQHFLGWIYTRSDVEINNANIGNNKIALYHYGDEDYTLVSPMVEATGVNNIVVKVTAKSIILQDDEYVYNPTKGSPTVELLDENESVIKSFKYYFTTTEVDRYFEVNFNISDIADRKFKLRLACWNADLSSALAIRKVVVEGCALEGDVNGDGVVTSADVTVLYDYLLNGDDSSIVNGDVDADGVITSADVTAVYSILLGES